MIDKNEIRRTIQIKESISSDGLGVPTISIYFSLCDKKEITGSYCKNCHNKELQENKIGYNLTLNEIKEIVHSKVKNFISIFGKCEVALLGGEPLSYYNRDFSIELSEYFNKNDVKIILYTWRTKLDLDKEKLNLKYFNRIVTGEYIEELKNEEYILGSINQEILDKNGDVILKYKGADKICT